jgi:hypothetical protein
VDICPFTNGETEAEEDWGLSEELLTQLGPNPSSPVQPGSLADLPLPLLLTLSPQPTPRIELTPVGLVLGSSGAWICRVRTLGGNRSLLRQGSSGASRAAGMRGGVEGVCHSGCSENMVALVWGPERLPMVCFHCSCHMHQSV